MGNDYTYAVARLRAIESERPGTQWFERLARTNIDGLLPSLRERYPGFEGIESPFDFETGLDRQRTADLRLVASLVTDPRTAVFLFSGYDFDNAVRIYKARRLGVEGEYYRCGLVPVESLERAVAGAGATGVPPYCAALLEAIDTAGEEPALADVEYLAESRKWLHLLEAAPGGDAVAYTRARIDLANIKTFVRLKRTSIRAAGSDAVWLEGGRIERSRLHGFLRGAEDEFYSYLHYTDYRGLVDRGLGPDMKLWKIDAFIRQALLDFLRESRYRFFDVTPVIYHVELLEYEYMLVRAVLSGKMNAVPERFLLEELETLLPA
jgi:hypothetical protein